MELFKILIGPLIEAFALIPFCYLCFLGLRGSYRSHYDQKEVWLLLGWELLYNLLLVLMVASIPSPLVVLHIILLFLAQTRLSILQFKFLGIGLSDSIHLLLPKRKTFREHLLPLLLVILGVIALDLLCIALKDQSLFINLLTGGMIFGITVYKTNDMYCDYHEFRNQDKPWILLGYHFLSFLLYLALVLYSGSPLSLLFSLPLLFCEVRGSSIKTKMMFANTRAILDGDKPMGRWEVVG